MSEIIVIVDVLAFALSPLCTLDTVIKFKFSSTEVPMLKVTGSESTFSVPCLTTAKPSSFSFSLGFSNKLRRFAGIFSNAESVLSSSCFFSSRVSSAFVTLSGGSDFWKGGGGLIMGAGGVTGGVIGEDGGVGRIGNGTRGAGGGGGGGGGAGPFSLSGTVELCWECNGGGGGAGPLSLDVLRCISSFLSS